MTESITYWSETDPFEGAAVVQPITAAGFPVKPPADWFADPKLGRTTPLTITADGRVFGHIAPWNARHIGLPGNVKPPRSRSKYAFFNKGALETAEGTDVTVGQLTLTGGHAPLHADASRAAAHYDDTRSAFADIHVGDDRHGIWAAGALRPDVTDTQIRAIRASVPSGDWRPINGSLELVAVCQVNSGGFPVARAAMVASGEITALVAAGARQMYELKLDGARGDLRRRVGRLELQLNNVERRAALVARVRGGG